MNNYNYKLESALKKAVEKNKKRMQLNSRLDVENAIWFVYDLLNEYGDKETAMKMHGLVNAVDDLDTSILVKAQIFE